MPIYEFRCRRCGKITEKLCRLEESGEDLPCSYCTERELQKIFSLIQRPARSGESSAAGGSCGSCNGGSCATCH